MNQGTFEFFASKHVHQWIVESVDGEPIDQIWVNSMSYWAVNLETKTPINSDAIHSDRESTKPERQHINRHA